MAAPPVLKTSDACHTHTDRVHVSSSRQLVCGWCEIRAFPPAVWSAPLHLSTSISKGFRGKWTLFSSSEDELGQREESSDLRSVTVHLLKAQSSFLDRTCVFFVVFLWSNCWSGCLFPPSPSPTDKNWRSRTPALSIYIDKRFSPSDSPVETRQESLISLNMACHWPWTFRHCKWTKANSKSQWNTLRRRTKASTIQWILNKYCIFATITFLWIMLEHQPHTSAPLFSYLEMWW